MPGIGCKALNSFQLVAGVDLHNQIPPPPPAGPVPAPHVVAYCIGFAMPATSKEAPTVKAGWGSALGRQHDIGMGPYHFAANALLPLVWAGAGNKAEFGSGTVQIPTGRMAVALIPFVGINRQLDCNDVPCAMPTSLCFASFNTVVAGFTLGDCVGGFAAMIGDIAITFVVGKIAGRVAGTVVGGAVSLLGRALGKVSIPMLLKLGVVAAANPTVGKIVTDATTMVGGWIIGSPLGYSFDGKWQGFGGKVNDAVNDYLSPAPAPPLLGKKDDPESGGSSGGEPSSGGRGSPSKPDASVPYNP